MDGHALLVKPDTALAQMEAEKPVPAPVVPATNAFPQTNQASERVREQPGTTGTLPLEPPTPTVRQPRRFHGTISIDALRLSRDVATIHQEVIQHLTALMGAHAEITLEVSIRVPDGVTESTVRTVTENCRTLKFTNHGFEDD